MERPGVLGLSSHAQLWGQGWAWELGGSAPSPCAWGVRSAAAGFSFRGGPRPDSAVCQGLRELGVRVSWAGGRKGSRASWQDVRRRNREPGQRWRATCRESRSWDDWPPEFIFAPVREPLKYVHIVFILSYESVNCISERIFSPTFPGTELWVI